MDAFAASLARSPELFPLTLDVAADSVSFIHLSEGDYARASFLDGRIRTPSTLLRSLSWERLIPAVEQAGLPERGGFVFHIGHAGSTLLSRLLGAHPAVLALREPAILRDLALLRVLPASPLRHWTEASFEARLGALLRLWSRTFRPEQLAIIKATSFVSELAVNILSRPSQPKAILMYAPPETYLATILGAPNSPQEARMLGESRLSRLHRRLGEERWALGAMSIGETVAMSWACETLALSAAAGAAGERALWLNFDSFLAEPAAHLSEAFRHFGIAVTPGELEAIVSGPETRRYSKGPEHAYDADLRQDVLNQGRGQHASEIARGLKWLESAAAEFPHMAEVRGF